MLGTHFAFGVLETEGWRRRGNKEMISTVIFRKMWKEPFGVRAENIQVGEHVRATKYATGS